MSETGGVQLQPLYTTHNLHREGGRKTHIADRGVSLCGLVERQGRFVATLGDQIAGGAAIRTWIESDSDGELCWRCVTAVSRLLQPEADKS
ncbi:hypothetical protein ABIC83_002404 [Roseateles asaccharophilus]